MITILLKNMNLLMMTANFYRKANGDEVYLESKVMFMKLNKRLCKEDTLSLINDQPILLWSMNLLRQ